MVLLSAEPRPAVAAPGPTRTPCRWIERPAVLGVLVGAALLATSVACVLVVARESVATYRAQYRADLERVAQAAASQLDVPLHEAIRGPEQQNGPEYMRAVAPLRAMLGRSEGLRYLYTAVASGDGVAFVLDASDPGDHDGDGRDDQAKILEPYAEAVPELLACLRTGATTSTAEPYEDAWGRFMSAWAPLLDAHGRTLGVVGVDVTAGRFDRDVASMSRARDLALLPAVLLSLAAGFGVHFLRRAERSAARKLDSALEATARHAQELQRANAELARARVEAEAANRAKSEFLANVSHEIRTPMTAILGFADILADDGAEVQRCEAVETIRRNGEHLLAILNDVLDISKIEAGQMRLELEPVDVAQVARDVVALERARAERKGLTLELRLRTRLPVSVPCDALRLRQILANLLGNAIKFTQRGSVALEAAYEEGRRLVVLEVRDTGIGMSPEELDRLFQPFSQADTSTSRRFGGTGLGLMLSRRFAQMLGGEIRVESQAGAGSVFRVELPVSAGAAIELVDLATAAPTLPSRGRAGTAPRLDGLRVLAADDGRDNRRLIALHLGRAGAECVLVEDGEQAVAVLSEGGAPSGSLCGAPAFDVVLLDMQMPNLDGYETARRLRERGLWIPIVALTANAMSGDRERCLAAGCDEYLTKPIDREALLGLLSRLSGRGAGAARVAPAASGPVG